MAVFAADLNRSDSLELIASVGVKAGSPLHDVTLSPSDFFEPSSAEKLAPRYLEGAALDTLRNGPLAEQPWNAVVLLPMSFSGRMIGLVVVGFDESKSVRPGTRVALSGLAAEASAALGRARRYELEHEVALTLQESLHPTDLPSLQGWAVAARYEPGSEELVVGGDLFDVIGTDNNGLFVMVGDVVGHGLRAAAAMGQLRSAARALALVSSGPLEVMEGLEAFAKGTPGVMGASVACAHINHDGNGVYACAGHPFPILIRKDGESALLQGGRSALLGVTKEPPQSARFHMEIGDCLVLYTDGVIEHGSAHIDQGIEHLRRTLTDARSAGGRIDPDHVVDLILDGSSPRDDMVVLCATRVVSEPNGSPADA